METIESCPFGRIKYTHNMCDACRFGTNVCKIQLIGKEEVQKTRKIQERHLRNTNWEMYKKKEKV